MANELTVTGSISYEKDNDSATFSPDSQQVTVSGQQRTGGVQLLTTTAEVLALNEVLVTTQGWAWFRNIGTDLDTAIQIGIKVSTNFHDVLELKGGEFAMSRLAGEALWAKATSGTLYLEYFIIED